MDLPGLRPQALALSPDGHILATSGKTHDLLIIDPVSWKVVQTVPLPPNPSSTNDAGQASPRNLAPDESSELSFTRVGFFRRTAPALYRSPTCRAASRCSGVDATNHVQGLQSFSLPPANAPGRHAEIPAGLACSPDGRRLYVALNLGNGVAELDTATGQVLRQWPAGVAPFDVALAGRKIYVSNWGWPCEARGRQRHRPGRTRHEGAGVDLTRYIASEALLGHGHRQRFGQRHRGNSCWQTRFRPGRGARRQMRRRGQFCQRHLECD